MRVGAGRATATGLSAGVPGEYSGDRHRFRSGGSAVRLDAGLSKDAGSRADSDGFARLGSGMADAGSSASSGRRKRGALWGSAARSEGSGRAGRSPGAREFGARAELVGRNVRGTGGGLLGAELLGAEDSPMAESSEDTGIRISEPSSESCTSSAQSGDSGQWDLDQLPKDGDLSSAGPSDSAEVRLVGGCDEHSDGSLLGRAQLADTGRWDLDQLPMESSGPSSRRAAPDPNDAERGGCWAGEAGQAPARDVDEEDHGDVPAPGWLARSERLTWRDRYVPERFRGMRVDPGRRGVLTLAVVGLVAVAIAGGMVFRERPVAHPVPPVPAVRTTPPETVRAAATAGLTSAAATGAVPAAPPTPADAELVVSVVGLVQRSGLVRLPAGARIADAITAAGGATTGADLNGLNLAQRLLDGDQVLVGSAPIAGEPPLGSTTLGPRPSTEPAPTSGAPATRATRVNLNTATESDLDSLPGVGPVTARAILAWRTTNGRFTAIDQLSEVEGIGPARLTRLRDLVMV